MSYLERSIGCPFKEGLGLGRISSLEDSKNKAQVRALVSMGKDSISNLLLSSDLKSLHPSEQITALEAVAIDRFCASFIEGCDIPPSIPLKKAFRIWGKETELNLGSDDFKLLTELDSLSSFLFGNGDIEIARSQGELCSFNAIEDLVMGAKTLNEAMSLLDKDDCSDEEFTRYCAVYCQQHLLDQGPFAPDREWTEFVDLEELRETTASLDELVQFCKQRVSKKALGVKLKALFSGLERGAFYQSDLAERDLVGLSQKPRIGCPWLYSGRLKDMLYYEFAYQRSKPKIQRQKSTDVDFASLFN